MNSVALINNNWTKKRVASLWLPLILMLLIVWSYSFHQFYQLSFLQYRIHPDYHNIQIKKTGPQSKEKDENVNTTLPVIQKDKNVLTTSGSYAIFNTHTPNGKKKFNIICI